MKVLDYSGRQEASFGKLVDHVPTPICSDDLDAINSEPSAKEEKEQKGPQGVPMKTVLHYHKGIVKKREPTTHKL